MDNQAKVILAHLSAGNALTPLEALTEFGCSRLAARVYDLKQLGHKINKELVALPNGKRVAEYRIAA